MESEKTITKPLEEEDMAEEMANENDAKEERGQCMKCGAALEEGYDGGICDECMLREKRKTARRVLGGVGIALACTAAVYFGGKYIKANPQKIERAKYAIKTYPKNRIIQTSENIRNNVKENVVKEPISRVRETGKRKLEKIRAHLPGRNMR